LPRAPGHEPGIGKFVAIASVLVAELMEPRGAIILSEKQDNKLVSFFESMPLPNSSGVR
jgi:hypothetical protein